MGDEPERRRYDHRSMIERRNTTRIRTIEQVQDFLDGTDKSDIEISRRTGAYDSPTRTVIEFEYHNRLSKPGKGLGVRRYTTKVLCRALRSRPPLPAPQDRPHLRTTAADPPATPSSATTAVPTSPCSPKVDEAGRLPAPWGSAVSPSRVIHDGGLRGLDLWVQVVYLQWVTKIHQRFPATNPG